MRIKIIGGQKFWWYSDNLFYQYDVIGVSKDKKNYIVIDKNQIYSNNRFGIMHVSKKDCEIINNDPIIFKYKLMKFIEDVDFLRIKFMDLFRKKPK